MRDISSENRNSTAEQPRSVFSQQNGTTHLGPQEDDDGEDQDQREDVFEWIDVMAHKSRLQAEKVQMLFFVFTAMLVSYHPAMQCSACSHLMCH